MAERRRNRHSPLYRRTVWGLVLPGASLGALVLVAVGAHAMAETLGIGVLPLLEGHTWFCVAIMALGIFPALALASLLESWFRPLFVPPAIPNLGRTSGCALTVVLGAGLPLLAVGAPVALRGLVSRLGRRPVLVPALPPPPRPASIRTPARAPAARQRPVTAAVTLSPVSVESFEVGDIVYADVDTVRVDSNGEAHCVTYVFEECWPHAVFPLGFTVQRSDVFTGVVEVYVLRERDSQKLHWFGSVPVWSRDGRTWAITDDGCQEIKDALEEEIGVRLARSPVPEPSTSLGWAPRAYPSVDAAVPRQENAPEIPERTGADPWKEMLAEAALEPGAWLPSWPTKVTRLLNGGRAFALLDADGEPTDVRCRFAIEPVRGEAFAVYDWGAGTECVEAVGARWDGGGQGVVVSYVAAEKRRYGQWAVSDAGWERIRGKLEATLGVRLRPLARPAQNADGERP